MQPMPGPHPQADLTDGAKGRGITGPGLLGEAPLSSPLPLSRGSLHPAVRTSSSTSGARTDTPPSHTHTPPSGPTRLLLEFFPFGPSHHPEAALAPPRHHLDSDPLSRIPPCPPPPEVETRNDFPHPLHGHRHRPTRCDLAPVMSLAISRARLHGKITIYA